MLRAAQAWAPELASVALAILAALWVAGNALAAGFPVDDAWIHMVYGLALRTGGGFSYNDGIAGAGSTSPLWAIVAALAHVAAGARGPSFDAALALKGCGVVAHAATAAVAARLARQCVPDRLAVPAALVSGALVAACPSLAYAAVSGMEVPLASALMLGAFLLASRQRPVPTGLLAGLGVLARPEAIVIAPLVILLSVRAPSAKGRWVRAASAAAGVIALPGLWVVRNLVVTGRPLPSTIYAKGVHGSAGSLDSLGLALFEMLGKSRPMNRGVVLVLGLAAIALGLRAAVAALRAGGREPRHDPALIAGAAALAALAYVAGIAWHTRFYEPGTFYFQRYLLPPVALLLIAASSVLARLLGWAARADPRRRFSAGVLGIAGVATAAWEAEAWGRRGARYAEDVASIDAVQVAVGQFLAATLPADATVWSVDAGAPRYFGRRRLVDLARLNTPELYSGDVLPPSWSADAVVLELPYGYRARVEGGSLTPVLTVPLDWASRPLPAGWPEKMPTQIVLRCPLAGGGLTVRRGAEIVARGSCAGPPLATATE